MKTNRTEQPNVDCQHVFTTQKRTELLLTECAKFCIAYMHRPDTVTNAQIQINKRAHAQFLSRSKHVSTQSIGSKSFRVNCRLKILTQNVNCQTSTDKTKHCSSDALLEIAMHFILFKRRVNDMTIKLDVSQHQYVQIAFEG